MALVTFTLDQPKYKNSLAVDFSISNFALKSINGNIDNAATVLIVDVDDNQFPGEIRYDFVPNEIAFCTKNPQSLYIPLVCYDLRAGTSSPRFHLHHLSSEAPILSAEHLSGTSWLTIPPFSVFPAGAYQAKITFNMPQDKGKRYKLNIGIWDLETNKPVDCDPLVGNDPP